MCLISVKLAGVTVNIPAGLWGGKQQLSVQEVSYTRKMSSARVHVERIIGYVII
jgi:hypothetical protein